MKTHLLFSLAFTAMIFSACAKSSSDSSAAAGTGTSTSVDTTTNASCNAFASSNGNFGGRIATYYSGSTFVEDHMRVRVTNLSSSFDSGSYTLKFFRMKADGSGYTLDSTPLTFIVYYGTSPVSSAVTSLSASDVSNLRSSSGIGSSSADFFMKTTIVLSGVDNSWQILKPALYSGSSVVAEANALMPLFTANPTTYAANHVQYLTSLHPFTSSASSSNTDAQWVALSNQNCFQ